MPSGYPFSRAVRREFLDLVCRGVPVIRAEGVVGVSLNTGSRWWREAGAMKLRVNAWGRGGLANPGDLGSPGGPGHRLSLDERIAIMRGLDAKLSYAEIGRRIGRDRSVVWRSISATPTLTGITTPAWLMLVRRKRPAVPGHSNSSITRYAQLSRRGWIRDGVPNSSLRCWRVITAMTGFYR